MVWVALFDNIRSMHDSALPRLKVVHAAGPGFAPFRICHPYNSHTSSNQGARSFVILSLLFLGIFISSIVGDSSPTRVFQSPQIIYVSWGGMHPSISSTKLLATCSSMPLFAKFGAGGR
jgi:hypothetical protein